MPSVKVLPVLQTWGRTLQGRLPSLSIEITRECPLRCPGCYAYDNAHLGTTSLLGVADYKGEELIARVLDLVAEYKPLHVSIVGGDPLVRYRELDVLLPQLVTRAHVHVVTSAFRQIPLAWGSLANLLLVVSVDGLQPEHDLRRRPATYERILRNIEGHHITIHCTITAAMMERDDYIPEFVDFWSENPAVDKIWMSIFTPQRGASIAECLGPGQRKRMVETLVHLGPRHPKLDMSESVIKEFLSPPESPEHCIFAQTTRVISADLKTRVEPCQFGGDPDCSRCGCVASMGLAAVGHRKLVGSITAGNVFWVSAAIGRQVWAVKRKVQSVLAMRPSSSDNSGPDTKPAHGSRSLAR